MCYHESIDVDCVVGRQVLLDGVLQTGYCWMTSLCRWLLLSALCTQEAVGIELTVLVTDLTPFDLEIV